MWKSILNFVLVNLAFIIVAVAIYAVGYEYDKAYKLYPESLMFGDFGIEGVYGQRWVRSLKAMLVFGAVADLIIILVWFRKLRYRFPQ